MKRALAIKLVLYPVLSLFIVVLICGGYFWYSMQKAMDAMYEPLLSKEWVEPVFETEPQFVAAAVQKDPSQSNAFINEEGAQQLLHPNLSDEDPFCILLLGVDERERDSGRSDTMILLTVQPRKGTAVAISIPRDTRVLMPHSGKYDKINHAYAFGGTSLAVEAVERLLGVPIAYYMKTNMEGIVRIVDIVGGVDIDNPMRFDYEGLSFPIGQQHLNGKEALAYSRMRKEDPRGDFGRTQRQRQILIDAVDRVASVNSIAKLPRLLSNLSEYVRTNLTSQNMIDLALNYRPAIQSVETLSLNGKGQIINGIYYYTVKPEDRQKIQEQLLQHLIAT